MNWLRSINMLNSAGLIPSVQEDGSADAGDHPWVLPLVGTSLVTGPIAWWLLGPTSLWDLFVSPLRARETHLQQPHTHNLACSSLHDSWKKDKYGRYNKSKCCYVFSYFLFGLVQLSSFKTGFVLKSKNVVFYHNYTESIVLRLKDILYKKAPTV